MTKDNGVKVDQGPGLMAQVHIRKENNLEILPWSRCEWCVSRRREEEDGVRMDRRKRKGVHEDIIGEETWMSTSQVKSIKDKENLCGHR